MSLVPVGRGRSTRSAMGGGLAARGCFFCLWTGRGIDDPPTASALLYGLRPQTVLRRTIDPSPSSVFSGAEHCPPGLGGGFGGWVGKRLCSASPQTSFADDHRLRLGYSFPWS